MNFKNDNIGFNHMTFCSSLYREAEHSMVKALQMVKSKNKRELKTLHYISVEIAIWIKY